MLELRCPCCQHLQQNYFEWFETNALDTGRCQRCCQFFTFLINACAHCDHVHVFAWSEHPSDASIARLICPACQHSTSLEQSALRAPKATVP